MDDRPVEPRGDCDKGCAEGLRHPEKAHRPDTATLRKPDWIRVKAFLMVSASPLTRSSYHADSDFARLQAAREAR